MPPARPCMRALPPSYITEEGESQPHAFLKIPTTPDAKCWIQPRMPPAPAFSPSHSRCIALCANEFSALPHPDSAWIERCGRPPIHNSTDVIPFSGRVTVLRQMVSQMLATSWRIPSNTTALGCWKSLKPVTTPRHHGTVPVFTLRTVCFNVVRAGGGQGLSIT